MLNSLWPREAIWRHRPYGTKPLPEPVLTNHQWGLETFTSRSLKIFIPDMSLKIIHLRLQLHFPVVNVLMYCISEVLCAPFDLDESVLVAYTGFGEDDIAQFSCASNHHSIGGEAQAWCNSDGTWSHRPLRCTRMLTHCGLMTPYGNIDLDHQGLRLCLVVWRRQYHDPTQ